LACGVEKLASARPYEDFRAELQSYREKARLFGGKEAIERIHSEGRMTARERLEGLLDPGSFVELDAFMTHRFTDFGMDKRKGLGDGVIAGYGLVGGRPVCVYAEDATFMGGSLGEAHLQKMGKTLDLALKMGVPFVGLNDSGGARIQEGAVSLSTLGEVFAKNVAASGVVPQITAVMGPCAGGAVYSPALEDFVIMVDKTSYMFITGPRVVKTVTGEEVSTESLGGARVQNTKSGVAHFLSSNEREALDLIRTLLSYLPSNNMEEPPTSKTEDPPDRIDENLNTLIPTDPSKSYNILDLVNRVFDRGSFFEVHRLFAQNAVVGFARLAGMPVGIVANQPAVMAGVLDINSADKIARFIRFCDCFNFPIVTFVDVPGYLPGVTQEHSGIIRHGAKVIYAYSEADVPKITVVVRKAYGGAYIGMCSKSLGGDVVFAYPSAEIAVMGPEGAVEIIYHRELESAPPEKRKEVAAQLAEEYRRRFANPYEAAARGYVNVVIEPKETRPELVKALKMLSLGKRVPKPAPPKKHGNIPL
jgi:acetyl-CoA carboxylase carboxyltransferase component